MGKAIVIAAIILAVALVIAVVVVVAKRAYEAPVIRRRELARLAQRATVNEVALEEIELAADNWKDVDSVLATEIRTILREHKEGRKKIV